jgi:hypothetical protein
MTENPKPRSRTASRFRSSKVGFPIRKSADQSSFAAPHGLSQRTTSFIASQRQGIHQMLLRHLIALTIDVHSPRQRSFDHSVALMIAGSRRIRERPMLASQPIQTDVSVATALARRRYLVSGQKLPGRRSDGCFFTMSNSETSRSRILPRHGIGF